MSNNELLDDWPSQPPKKITVGRGTETPRADPIQMLFDGIPAPVILSEDDELPLQRDLSAKLILQLVGWLFLVPAVMYFLYWLFEFLRAIA